MNLQRFIDAKQSELRALRIHMPEALKIERPDILGLLMTPPPAGESIRVIAEFKRASPSEGIINEQSDPRDIAEQYARAGASAMSVLCEEQYFKGHLSDLDAAAHAGIPLLRKDFIFDALQVQQSFSTPASAILLIVALSPDVKQLRALRELAESQGIHAIVEIFNESELAMARASGARLIQVNARNLETFSTDRIAGLRLASQRREGECWIAASALQIPAHLHEARDAGYHVALIGTTLMRSPEPEQTLRRLLQA